MTKVGKSPKEYSRERLKVLMSVAGKEFVKKGYRDCSLDQISRISGVSKNTIYRHFSGKEALFEAVLKENALAQGALVQEFDLDVSNPVESLRQFALHIYEIENMPKFRESLRLIISESARLPDVTARVRHFGVSAVLAKLTDFFQQLMINKKMFHPDAERAAILFAVLARGNIRPLLVSSKNIAAEKELLLMDIEVFLKGTGLS